MKRLSLLLFGLLLAGSLPGPGAGAARLNVVVVMTDDQTVADMKALPETRRLVGKAGTTFSNSFVSYALCCPSRATFLTGQVPHNHGVMGNAPPAGGYARLKQAETLPVWLQAAGYRTAHLGKYLNGYGLGDPLEVPQGWTHWYGLVDPTTYRLYDYTVNDDGVLRTFGEGAADYQTDVLAAEAERVLRAWAGTGEPFFLSVAPLAPHFERLQPNGPSTPPRPAPRHAGRFAAEPLPDKPSFNEADLADKPPHLAPQRSLSTVDRARIEANHRARLASLLAVDDLVARVVRTLRETGALSRTVLVFTSDNGFFLGEHRIPDGKILPYEEAIRVPLLIRGGGFPAGRTADQPVSNVDLAATLLALTGASPGLILDGVNLLPLALDPARGRGRSLLVEGRRTSALRPSFEAVRSGRYLWVEYAYGGRELYDLKLDPDQLQNRADAPEYATVRADLAKQLARLRSCRGKSCR